MVLRAVRMLRMVLPPVPPHAAGSGGQHALASRPCGACVGKDTHVYIGHTAIRPT